MSTNEKVEPKIITNGMASHWDAFFGTLPFALFGIICMIGKIRIPFVGVYAYLAFYVIVLLGLLIGLARGFPRWAYSYLGWSLVYAGWWTSMYTNGLKIFGYTMSDEAWGWRALYPFFITIGISILWTRSIRPLRKLFQGIWQDWTYLSLVLYTPVGFLLMLYDEVRAPYVIVFMIITTLAISASVWVFMRSTNPSHRFFTLLLGFAAGFIINRICESTWDFAADYGLPPAPPVPWYDSILDVIVMTGFWGVILLLPALVGFVRSIVNKDMTT